MNMNLESRTNQYFNIIVNEGYFSTVKRMRFKFEKLFKNIDFKNKKVLDIGGGIGLVSLYAAYMGAKHVVCLEPESHGSSSNTFERFNQLKSKLNLNNVIHSSETLQNYNAKTEKYDIVIMINSINHLDEEACIKLLSDPKSKSKYYEIFTKVFNLTNEKGYLIVTDCSSSNFFGKLKINNPFAPSITWELHQEPEVWVNMLQEVGFKYPEVRWNSFNRLGNIGDFFLGNEIIAYYFQSHFRLYLRKINSD